MKPLLLSACLVAAATVTAAALKDPAEVSREWNKAAGQPLRAQSGIADLKAQCPPPPIFPAREFGTVPVWEPRKEASPFEGGIIRPPNYDSKRIPKGAKPYEFNGERYWLIPITHEADA